MPTIKKSGKQLLKSRLLRKRTFRISRPKPKPKAGVTRTSTSTRPNASQDSAPNAIVIDNFPRSPPHKCTIVKSSEPKHYRIVEVISSSDEDNSEVEGLTAEEFLAKKVEVDLAQRAYAAEQARHFPSAAVRSPSVTSRNSKPEPSTPAIPASSFLQAWTERTCTECGFVFSHHTWKPRCDPCRNAEPTKRIPSCPASLPNQCIRCKGRAATPFHLDHCNECHAALQDEYFG